MAAPIKPQKQAAYGKRRLWLVDTIADTGAPEDTEINDGAYLTCFALSDQAGATTTPNKITLPVLLCETDSYEDFGTTANSHADITLLYDPQADVGDPGKTAWDLVYNDGDGYAGNVLWQLGEAGDEDDSVADGDRVTVVPAKLKVISEEPTSTGEDGLFAFQCSVAVTGKIRRNVEVTGS